MGVKHIDWKVARVLDKEENSERLVIEGAYDA